MRIASASIVGRMRDSSDDFLYDNSAETNDLAGILAYLQNTEGGGIARIARHAERRGRAGVGEIVMHRRAAFIISQCARRRALKISTR